MIDPTIIDRGLSTLAVHAFIDELARIAFGSTAEMVARWRDDDSPLDDLALISRILFGARLFIDLGVEPEDLLAGWRDEISRGVFLR